MEGVDLQHSLTFSSDTYYYRIGEAFWVAPDSEINPEGIQQTAREFGYGAPLGIQLPEERGGSMPNAEQFAQRHEDNPDAFPRGDWGPGDNTNIAIGQGEVAVTPLQLANSYAALANGGTVFSPNIVLRTVPNGDVDDPIEFGPRVLREATIPATIDQQILDGLLGVTQLPKLNESQPPGTAFDAFNRPFEEGLDGAIVDLVNWPVAGKTGTAEVFGRADNSMFVGFGPSGSATFGTAVESPEYVIAVVLEEAGFGSQIAAPMVARVFDRIARDEVPRASAQTEVDDFYTVDDITDALTDEVDEDVLEVAGGAR